MTVMVRPARFEPMMLDGGAGPLFAVHYPPHDAQRAHAVLYLPPFAEEQNRARRMAALQARALAEAGTGMLVLDPYGCGDSSGEFGDARWEIWRDDAARAAQWLRQRGYARITLLGLRLGALLALDAIANAGLAAERAVLWQPVLRGDQMMTQFLRLRLAAEIAGGARGSDGPAEIRRQLTAGDTVEIAGYDINRDLVAAIDKLKLAELAIAARTPVDWIDVATDVAQTSSPAQEQVLKRWQDAGLSFKHHRAIGEPFWTLQEITLAPALITLTSAVLGQER